ncbi:QWRF motif-containing protein 7-like [Macadamia integrifolia]|uniref:QWRF motif-containing protein 7-like n=1 Tax=Macadamia integrifolia TaxID=60698 RepID=UPI001C4FEA96|nr:QWRF motif-containing protein 7-like [Macadamia integrifolia]
MSNKIKPPSCLSVKSTIVSRELLSRQMEKYHSSRRKIAEDGNGIHRSPQLLRTTSTSLPEIPPLKLNSGRKSVALPNSATRIRISSSSRSSSTSRGSEENRNPSATIIPAIIKKPQADHKLMINIPVRNLQSHRSPDVVKFVEKVKPKRPGSVSPSAWALSPGRSSSSIFPVPESPDNNSGRTATTTTKQSSQSSRSVSSVLNYFRQKKASSVQEEAFHQLRIMHTRLLQWRFANARAQSTLAATKHFAEDRIFKVWLRIYHLRNSILEKRLQIQKLKHEMKIIQIINPQVCILSEWEKIEKKNSEAVARIGRKLSASSTALPLINGAKADTDSIQNAMLTAIGVMESIEGTIMKFISKVEETGSLASELVNTIEQEKKGLEELRKEITVVASLEAEEKSLTAHTIQGATQKMVGRNHLLSSNKLTAAWYRNVKEKAIPQQKYRKGHFLRLYLSNVQSKDNLGQES